MTRKEKKEELIGLFAVGAIFIGDLIDECFEFGQHHPRWISVEDELPPRELCDVPTPISPSLKVLAHADWGYIGVGIYNPIANTFNWENGNLCTNITHWAPLPSPPEKLSSLERTGKNEQ